jgi:hypothetical protein
MGLSISADPITEVLTGDLVLDVKVKAVGTCESTPRHRNKRGKN